MGSTRRSPQRRPRVAVVGFQKTGTTSLKLALEYLGYRVNQVSWPPMKAAFEGDLDGLRALAGKYDALQDMPWFLYYRELDEWFPGTRFVLTTRNDDAWMASYRAHFSDDPTLAQRYARAQRRVFGDVAPAGEDEEPYRERFRQHNAAVMEHFADRPGDLLVLRLGEGHEWERLARHLGARPPRSRRASRRRSRTPIRAARVRIPP